jgi:hypothetical protein
MLSIHNQSILLSCDESGHNLVLIDRKRGTRWLLDEKSLGYGGVSNNPWGGFGSDPMPMSPIQVMVDYPEKLTVTYQAGESTLEIHFLLHDDYLEVRLPIPTSDEIGYVTLPGSFTPEGERIKLLLPIMQGMLWDGRGPNFSFIRGEGSHQGFSMAFIGFLSEKGGLLLTVETRDDTRWWFGKEQVSTPPGSRIWAANIQLASLGTMRYERVVRIYLTDPDIVAITRQYRQKVIAQGRFKTWDEKIAERPAVERLFGTLMCYIGYCRDELEGQPLNYVKNFHKLKAYGFNRALVYPARFNIYYSDIRMGGVPAINLDRETIQAIDALGYDVAPWSWLNEALEASPENIQQLYRRDVNGQVIPHWSIDDQQWYLECYSAIPDFQQRALLNDLTDMSWDHFDVLSCVPPMECYALDHPHHIGRPMSRSEDRHWVKNSFMVDQAAGRIVSSENFNDAYVMEQDLGSVKAWPQYGPWPFWPVPLTMLVYHDCMIHSWWEIHSYNNPWRGRTTAQNGLFEYGGGRPKLQAALDALMGCPPDVFPFGAQYGYTGKGKETFLYRYRFEDPEVQLALREALPVARWHRLIGKQAMVDFRILSEDGYVQETTFADGRRVVANFSRDFVGEIPGIDHKVVPGIKTLGPESWQVI